MITLVGKGLSKRFGARKVLADVSLEATTGTVVGITGFNGSGKSTLMNILAGVVRADAGVVQLDVEGSAISAEELPYHVGLVSPAMNIYGEFTPRELLDLQSSLRGTSLTEQGAKDILERVGLTDRANDLTRTFSSGLRQRVLIALAIAPEPAVLLLDEPSITLDDVGRTIVEREIDRQRSRGIVVVATNDEREKTWATTNVHLG